MMRRERESEGAHEAKVARHSHLQRELRKWSVDEDGVNDAEHEVGFDGELGFSLIHIFTI